MRALLAAAAALMIGCAAAEKEPSALGAPTPSGVAMRISSSMNGETVRVKSGETIAVELVGIPTAGYLWAAVETPAFLEPAGEYSGPTSSAQNEPGWTGGNHWEGFLFEVTGAGEGDLRFEQRRPWESDEPASGSFSVRVISEE